MCVQWIYIFIRRMLVRHTGCRCHSRLSLHVTLVLLVAVLLAHSWCAKCYTKWENRALSAAYAPNQIAFSQYCLVPIFSFIKERHNDKDYNDDLLVPLMAYPQEGLVYYPPEQKVGYGPCRRACMHG